jgi:hypothetical protein
MVIVFDMTTGSVATDYDQVGYEAAHPVVLIGSEDMHGGAHRPALAEVKLDEAEAFLERFYSQG